VFVGLIMIAFTVIPPIAYGYKYLLFTLAGILGFISPIRIMNLFILTKPGALFLKILGPALVVGYLLFRQEFIDASMVIHAAGTYVGSFYICAYFLYMTDQ
jgi:hypothetical protein